MQKSFVWNYFTRLGDKAQCKVQGCNALFTTKASSPLAYHLEHRHDIYKPVTSNSSSVDHPNPSETNESDPQNQESAEVQQQEEPKQKKQKTILDCFSFKSLEEAVARLACEDGLTIRQITRSEFLQEALSSKFSKRNVPKTENGTMALIDNFYEQIKQGTKHKIASLKKEGTRFSATLDEWTSLKNLRFLNINVHYAVACSKVQYINLGMVKIDGSCPADQMLLLVKILNFGQMTMLTF